MTEVDCVVRSVWNEFGEVFGLSEVQVLDRTCKVV